MDEEERNYCCLAILLTRVGVDRLRQLFIRRWDADGTFRPWQDQPYNGSDLLTKFTPLPYEKAKVKSGDTTRWDLSLLVKALLYSKPPFVTDKTLVKSLKCLKKARDTAVCHSSNGKIAADDFKNLWSGVCNALVVLGATSEDFKKVKRDVKLPWNELTSLMKQCANQNDEILDGFQTIQERLQQLQVGQREMQQEMIKGHEQIKEEIKEGRDQIKQELKNLFPGTVTSSQKLSHEEIQQRSEYLKASTRQQTQFQPKLVASHSFTNVRTDDIFTNLVMQHGRKSLPKDTSRWEQLSEYSKTSGKPIERVQDIFIPHKKETPCPKSILVTGKPGIGKSIFCQKLVRDWASGELFQEQSASDDHGFDFVYLLTFRHLNLICEEELTLRDLLNRCSLLDEQSNIDDSLFQHMLEHQDRVLLLIDGYDEFAERSSITSDSIEQKYENNPSIALPVTVLLSKLLKRKIFGKSVVMITSRPTESNELGGMSFDTLMEIVGFSKTEVEEFIRKYFKSNEKGRNKALQYVMNNNDLLSLAHVPMFCFLMCWCMEWHMEFTSDQDLPLTITELYSDFVEIFESKHNSKSKYRSEQIPEQFQCPDVVKTTLEKLSKLAVEMMKQKQFTFEKHELIKYGLAAEEIDDLKESGVLTSGPGLRVSATKIVHYYTFSHLTLHEYLTACWFVNNKQVPLQDEINSEMVLRFFTGLCKKEQCKELMEELFSQFNKQIFNVCGQSFGSGLHTLFTRFLYEYNDREFGAEMIYLYPLLFCWDSKEMIHFFDNQISIFFLNVLNYSCGKYLDKDVDGSPPDCCVIKKLMVGYKGTLEDDTYHTFLEELPNVLSNSFCPITSLCFNLLLRSGAKAFLMSLPNTNITDLELVIGDIDQCLPIIRKVLLDAKCKIKTLICSSCLQKEKTVLESFSQEMLTIKPDIRIYIKEELTVAKIGNS